MLLSTEWAGSGRPCGEGPGHRQGSALAPCPPPVKFQIRLQTHQTAWALSSYHQRWPARRRKQKLPWGSPGFQPHSYREKGKTGVSKGGEERHSCALTHSPPNTSSLPFSLGQSNCCQPCLEHSGPNSWLWELQVARKSLGLHIWRAFARAVPSALNALPCTLAGPSSSLSF